MTSSIRPYHASDFDAVYALWQASLGALWQITPEALQHMISPYLHYQANHLIAEQQGRIVGFIATLSDLPAKTVGIQVLMVHPENQRQGIGTGLHTAAIELLRRKAVETVGLAGHGVSEPLWPGVPLNVPDAVEFFRALGWDFTNTSYDLTRDLITYQTPQHILERITVHQIELRAPSPDEIAALLDFERHHFPSWLEAFQLTTDAGRYDDILAAWDENTIVGTLLLEKMDLAQITPSAVWHQLLGEAMGSIGAVGVDEQHRGKGIGLALVAKASEILQARGVRQCLIGWTDLLDFYGKLGYSVWRAYAMADQRLISEMA